MKTYSKTLVALLLAPALAACGGGGGGGSSSSTPTPSPVVSLSANNLRFNSVENQTASINLLAQAKASDGSAIVVSKVEPISDQSQCAYITQTDQGFDFEPNDVGSCVYSYQIASAADPSIVTTATAQVGILSDNSVNAASTESTPNTLQLPPLSAAIQQGDADLVLDLETLLTEQGEWPGEGFSLDEAPTLLGGADGESLAYDTTANTITLDSNREFGISRVYYSLSNSTDTYLGAIDVAVSQDVNHGIEITDFSIDATEGEEVTVDLTDYIDDLDASNSLTLVSATTENAEIEMVDDISFKFTPSIPITYYVSVMVTDNQGDYAMGIVTINVGSPYQPIDLTSDGITFMPPFTLQDTLLKGLDYTASITDTSTGETIEVPNFDFDVAEAICTAFGGRLATIAELNALYAQEGNLAEINGWPTSRSYISSDLDSEDNTKYIAFDFIEGQEETANLGTNEVAATANYITCVQVSTRALEIVALKGTLAAGTSGRAKALASTTVGAKPTQEPQVELIWSSSDESVLSISPDGSSYEVVGAPGDSATVSVSTLEGQTTAQAEVIIE